MVSNRGQTITWTCLLCRFWQCYSLTPVTGGGDVVGHPEWMRGNDVGVGAGQTIRAVHNADVRVNSAQGENGGVGVRAGIVKPWLGCCQRNARDEGENGKFGFHGEEANSWPGWIFHAAAWMKPCTN
jgi:hypothetical protein